MVGQTIGEIIPDIYINKPFEVMEENKSTKYNIQYAIRLGIFNYAYNGIEDKTKKEVLIKYISTNSLLLTNSLINILKSKNNSSNYLLNFISTGICKNYKSPFLIMAGGWNNLSELINWHGPRVYNPDTFLIPAIDAINFLDNCDIVHGYLKTSSFWYKQQDKCKNDSNCRLLCIEKIILGDYEKSFLDDKYFENINTISNTSNNSSEIINISKQRSEGSACNLKYCAAINHTSRNRSQINDYESLFYILIELYEHRLPWEHLHSDEKMIKQKKEALRSPECSFYYNTPEDLAEIVCIIDKYVYLKDHTEKLYNVIKEKYEYYIKKYLLNDSNSKMLNDTEYVRIAGIFRANNNIPTIYNKTYVPPGTCLITNKIKSKDEDKIISPRNNEKQTFDNNGKGLTKNYGKKLLGKLNKNSVSNQSNEPTNKITKTSSEKHLHNMKTSVNITKTVVEDSKRNKHMKKLFSKIFKPK
ncbi:Protein kinase-like domain-containing protein [Strongyloides ratti]|uniref:Protein kinase-like domain-containing protein n=1 Tax=Strongyloides ratti TaxID=34506 RepID=A0A090MXV8_STRRB|nr:Protein kinase-like domain-containing protein [Strongyloides ratti]CEF66109.1 Protein kinase-like domain-containing protein [Strongyloides ratti]